MFLVFLRINIINYLFIAPWKWVNFLTARQAWVRETPIILSSSADLEALANSDIPSASKKQSTPGSKKTRVPDDALPDLIRLIHGNSHGRNFLTKEFIIFWQKKNPHVQGHLSKSSVGQKIGELARRVACPEEGPMHLKTCWYVSEETRKRYLSEDLPLPNQWSYALTPNRKKIIETLEIVEKIDKDKDSDREKELKDKEKKTVPLITQFTKKITQEEMKQQLSVKPIGSPKMSITPNKPAKRAVLISVGRGEQFPNASIVNAFSKVAHNSKSIVNNPGSPDEVITIDDSSQSPVKNETDNISTKECSSIVTEQTKFVEKTE